MGRKPIQAFLQKRHTDGHQAHEKMFNIINYKCKSKLQLDITSHQPKSLKSIQTTNIGERIKKQEPSYTSTATVESVVSPHKAKNIVSI